MVNPPRAVVVGASGIGKHHVKWLMRAGCDVVGFIGTSPESVSRTSEMLAEVCGFAGTGFTSMAELVGECQPQLASVCSPMEVHFEHVAACLGAGAHVLCEKPIVGGESLCTESQLHLGERLVELADKCGRFLGVNTQYAAVAPHLEAICAKMGIAPSPTTEFSMQMESRGEGGARQYDAIWHDLAPHPLSVLLALVPDGEVDWLSVDCVLEKWRNECTFDFAPPEGPVCKARLLLQTVPEGPMTRQFSLNGVNIQYEGRNDENGVYCSYLTYAGTEAKEQDFMEASITRFAAAAVGQGELLADGRTGLRNLELQLRLIEQARRR